MYDLAYYKAKEMLQKNRQVLEKIVEELLEFEILTRKVNTVILNCSNYHVCSTISLNMTLWLEFPQVNCCKSFSHIFMDFERLIWRSKYQISAHYV